jgi:hypothetical protein
MAVESDRQPSELNKDQIRETLNEWLSDFQVPSELATYYTVIGNLVVQAPIKVGTVTLSPLNEESRDAMLNEFNRAIDGSIDPQESKEQFKQFIVTNLSVDQKRVIASAEINEAESHRAWEIFQERIREVLHALRFFGSFVYPRRHHAMIDFAGYVYCGRNVFLRLVAGKQAGLNLQNTGYLLPYELVGERLQHLENVGLHIVGDILSKQQGERTPLERSCINAITWISRALEDDVADSRFLKLCIALESILLRRDDQPYRQIMAERVAFILGQDLDGRLIVARDIKKIYDIRSSIVHEGHSEGLEEWLGKTEFYATRTVLRFIQLMREKGWDSENAFIDWLDSLKFA